MVIDRQDPRIGLRPFYMTDMVGTKIAGAYVEIFVSCKIIEPQECLTHVRSTRQTWGWLHIGSANVFYDIRLRILIRNEIKNLED